MKRMLSMFVASAALVLMVGIGHAQAHKPVPATLTISPASPVPLGASVTVTGDNFAPDTSVMLFIAGEAYQQFAQVDANGHFSVLFGEQLTSPGLYTMVADTADGSRTLARASFEVE